MSEAFDEAQMQESLKALNVMLTAAGLPSLAVIPPEACIPQDVNARFMDQQMMDRLVDNIRRDGHLESVPLVAPAEAEGKYQIISGHHRIEAAVRASRKWIIAMVVTVADMDELRAKQLSHNAIEGEDDDVVLQKMYEGLTTLEAKMYSGLQDKLQSMSVLSLSFRAGSFESFTVAFLPGEVQGFDRAVEVVKELPVASSSKVRVAELAAYDMFSKAIREVKRVEDVKSSGTALTTLIELAMERLEQRKVEKADQAAAEAAAQAAIEATPPETTEAPETAQAPEPAKKARKPKAKKAVTEGVA